MIDDFVVFVNRFQVANHEDILTILVNDPFVSGKEGLAKLIPMTKFVDQIACTHGLKHIPNSYQRRSQNINFIFTSP